MFRRAYEKYSKKNNKKWNKQSWKINKSRKTSTYINI